MYERYECENYRNNIEKKQKFARGKTKETIIIFLCTGLVSRYLYQTSLCTKADINVSGLIFSANSMVRLRYLIKIYVVIDQNNYN